MDNHSSKGLDELTVADAPAHGKIIEPRNPLSIARFDFAA
ncbi:MAG: hypothetical protein RLY70_494 [Planctomycetota bacterium]|jgi:hypothetical protein